MRLNDRPVRVGCVWLFGHWLGARGILDPRHRSQEFYQAVHLASKAA